MAYGLFINTIYRYIGINDPSKDNTSKVVFYVKANQMSVVSCLTVNSRIIKIKAKMKTRMAWHFSLLLKVSAKELESSLGF